MSRKYLFSYTIDDYEKYKIDVFLTSEQNVRSSFYSEEFYDGIVKAIAEYLCYPYEIINSRIFSFPIKITCDKSAIDEIILLTDGIGYITEWTKGSFLEFMEKEPELAKEIIPEYTITPDLRKERVDNWCRELRDRVSQTNIDVVKTNDEAGFQWLEFKHSKSKFYARYWENRNASGYLMISLPCYGSEWNDMTEYISKDYDILQISPLGYNTPKGFEKTKMKYNTWPVLYDTLTEPDANKGYAAWFFDVIVAIEAVRKENKKLIFIGTSQGGAAALIMSSIYNDITTCCTSEMPFLIGFSDYAYNDVRYGVASRSGRFVYDFIAKEILYVIDPMNHTDRIKCPVLLLSGEKDSICPKEGIENLYNDLKTIKKYIDIKDAEHGYTDEFKRLSGRWIKSNKK